jgi:TRAP transporter TAXI family solute receptor
MVVAGHPAISELAISTDLVFLPMSDEIIKKLEPYGYKRTFLPAKSFKGQDKDIPLVGWPTILVAHKDVQPEVAYILTKSIVENKPELVRGHSGLKDFMPEDAWKVSAYGILLHPGAEKYYRDKGMIK